MWVGGARSWWVRGARSLRVGGSAQLAGAAPACARRARSQGPAAHGGRQGSHGAGRLPASLAHATTAVPLPRPSALASGWNQLSTVGSPIPSGLRAEAGCALVPGRRARRCSLTVDRAAFQQFMRLRTWAWIQASSLAQPGPTAARHVGAVPRLQAALPAPLREGVTALLAPRTRACRALCPQQRLCRAPPARRAR